MLSVQIVALIFVFFNLRCFIKTENTLFKVAYQWKHINYTWKTPDDYLKAIETKRYIPKNVVPAGVKIYQNQIFLALPKWLDGVPATLAYFPKQTKQSEVALIPFPSWESHNEENCSNLQNIQSMEIDIDGIMWIIDGVRSRNITNCPCKLVLLDLKNRGKITHAYTFPEEICRTYGGFLNDIVVDDTDGGYAYITDSSSIDPGLIVYSKEKNRSWKVRDVSMLASDDAPKFKLDGDYTTNKGPINGIALSPKKFSGIKERDLFYSVLTGYNLYSISTDILRNETSCKTNNWKKAITFVGRKQGQTGGMICDAGGNLFYTLQSLNGIGKWNVYRNFSTSEVLAVDNETLLWPDSFAVDNIDRDLYILSNHAASFFNPKVHLDLNAVKFRLLKYHTGQESYICTGSQKKVHCSCSCGGKHFWYCH